ncbi:MAG: AlpA family phage regulatory protein [Candidatus Hydrogenedentes bacterium]|nr:AlpA family phage regulatory protein [Candidatus Hydrogenedentota bacterium]
MDRTGLRRSSILDGVVRGNFPSPIKLSSRAVGWLESDVNGWIESRIAASRNVDGIGQ